MKKVFIVAIVITLLGVTTVYGAAYTDVWSSNWAYQAVYNMSEKGIVSGYPDETFKPNIKVTYGEFIKMAVIAETGENLGNAESGHWAESYYKKAIELGYFTTDDISKSVLGEDITRAHMALIISSILGDVKIENYDEIKEWITDINDNSPYGYDIAKTYASGILSGYPDKTFKPDKTLSRAEAAMVVYRLVDESARVSTIVSTIKAQKEGPADKKPLDEVITNLRTFQLDDGSFDKELAKTISYEIITNSNGGIYTKDGFYGARSLNFPVGSELYEGGKYLIKDNKVVEYLCGSTAEGEICSVSITGIDITAADYIASLNFDNYHMTIVINPFKKK